MNRVDMHLSDNIFHVYVSILTLRYNVSVHSLCKLRC
jgi:hypothetical protein